MMEEEEYLGSEEQRQDPLEGFNLVLLDNYFASRSPEPKMGITGDSLGDTPKDAATVFLRPQKRNYNNNYTYGITR